MSLSPGTRLGHYDVTALIGEGGMGQVYQATDTLLNRQVALKILPDAFADDPDRLARFQREAQVLASLNHPNIAAIHGIEKSGDTQALVLELVEGPTLADRIAKGPIPIDEALPIAKQIAEALEAAHEAGVIHRDLKPANIKVRDEGTVKVLDFGLAKALAGEASEPDLSQSPTMTGTMGGTREGVILGTAAYMSPEQARGKPLDKRTDIWSFGCVLFEMLTGRAAFAGETLSDTIGRVMEREPEWGLLPTGIPAALLTYLRRCLQKSTKERVRDMGDVGLALAGGFDVPAQTPVEPLEQPVSALAPRVWQRPVPATIAALILLVVGGLGAWSFTAPTPAERPIARFAIDLPEGALFSALTRHVVAISPDGQYVAYVANQRIYLRRLDRMDATQVLGTEDSAVQRAGRSPFFHPTASGWGSGRRDSFSGCRSTVAPPCRWARRGSRGV